MTLRILILEDNPIDAELMENELKEAGFAFTSKRVMTEDEFVQGLEEFSPDIILSDYDLPQYNGALALAEARKRCPNIPFILVTGAVSEDRAIEILTSGARDYVLKRRLNRLVPAVQRALTEAEEHRARQKAEEALRESHKTMEDQVRRRTAELQEEINQHKQTEDKLRKAHERAEWLARFPEQSPNPIVRVSIDGSILYCNPAASGMPGWACKVGQQLFGPLLSLFEQVLTNQRETGQDVALRGRFYFVSVVPYPEDGYVNIYGRDITERKRADEVLRRQAEFEVIISGLLARFASCTAAEVDNEIMSGLKEIGLFLGLESIFVILTSRESGTWSSVYNWIEPGFPSFVQKYQNVPIGTNPWSEKALLRMEAIQINSLDDLPPEAESERREWKREGLKSLLLVPLRGRGKLVTGSTGFRSYSRQIQWTREHIRSLRLFSDAVANVLERKRVEEELKRSEASLRDAQRLAKVGSWEWECGTGAVRWSDEMYVIHGVDPQTFSDIPGNYLNLVHPDDRKSVEESVLHSWEGSIPNSMKYRIVLPDGFVRKVHSQGEIVAVDEKGKPARMIGTVQDITEREQAEETIRALIDATHDFVCLFDAEGNVIVANKAFAYSFGKDVSELIGRHLTEIIPSKAGIRRWRYAQEAIGKGEVIRFDDERDGHYYNSIFYPILNSQGKTEKLAVFAQEITESKRIREELEKRTVQLEQANRELETFTYTASHDLQAPLRAINGFSEMILKDKGSDLDDETVRRLAVIQENTEKMQQLIEDLLNLSRIGRQALSLKVIDMDALVKDVWKELEAVYHEKPLVLKTQDLLPAFGDQALIRQVLVNLLSNAIKYSAPRKRIEVEVGSYRQNSGNVYYVKDHGVGFDMTFYDKLFGVFQRLHNASEFEGTGIGLAIAQRIVHLHGGQIWAEGQEGEGAIFYFMLPGESEKMGMKSSTD